MATSYAKTQYLDDAVLQDGDTGFIGVDMRTDPRLLEPGMAAFAWNKDFSLRKAESRRGQRTVAWAQEKGVDFPLVMFPFDFAVPGGFGTIYGELVVSDPGSGGEFGLLATAKGTYVVAANQQVAFVLYPVSDDGLNGPVTMVQAFSKVLMFRGSNSTLEWDMDLASRWTDITQSDSRGSDADNSFGTGTEIIPDSSEACVFNNRVFPVIGRDEIGASDIFDYTRYSPVTARFRINHGSSDSITRVYPFNQTTLIVFKGRSINLLGNIYGALQDVRNDLLTAEYGCIAKKTVTTVGNDVWFLSEGGVYTIRQALDNKLQANADPVTAPIEPLMRRVNWTAAQNACAVYFENKFYLALPLDGSLYNNAVLVYDLLNGRWSGGWSHRWMDVHGFLRLSNGGARRLFFVNGDNVAGAEGVLFLVGSGRRDELFGMSAEIEDELLTRGYSASRLDQKMFTAATLDLETWEPKYSADLLLDGVNEVIPLCSDQEKNPRKYYTFGKKDWDPTNVNDDHGEPWREDYALIVPSENGVDFPVDFGCAFSDALHLGSGVNPDQSQRVQAPYRSRARGQYAQMRIRNRKGRCAVHSVVVEAVPGARGLGIKA